MGELAQDAVTDDRIALDMTLYSGLASTSAGGELSDCEVIVFANSPTATGPYRIGHAALQDAIDATGVGAALRAAGLGNDGDPDGGQRDRIAAAFAKAEAPVGGLLRGYRTTMLLTGEDRIGEGPTV